MASRKGVINRAAPPRIVSSATSLTVDDSLVIGDTDTGGSFAVTLPDAAALAGNKIYIKANNTLGNSLTVNTSLSQTIDGASSVVLSQAYDYLLVISDGTNWWVESSLSSGSTASTNPQRVFLLDCTAESSKTLSDGANTLDSGATIYGRNSSKASTFGFDGTKLSIVHSSGTTSNYEAGIRDSPTVYFRLAEIDGDYSPANSYAFLVHCDVADETSGVRMGLIGCEWIYDLTGSGFSYCTWFIGHNGSTNNRVAIKSTVGSNSDAKGADNGTIRQQSGKMVAIDQHGMCTMGTGSGWSGTAWGDWSMFGVGNGNLNQNRTRITTQLGNPVDVQPLIAVVKTISTGTATIDVDRIEVWRVAGGALKVP